MNLKEIKDLIELVDDKGFAEFEIERQGFRLRISRFNETHAQTAQTAPPISSGVVGTSGGPTPGAQKKLPVDADTVTGSKPTATAKSDETATAAAENTQIIKSPIVGTFYRAPSPGSDPFVNIGDLVGPDTVVCIIEAMKLMNEIQAEASGEVINILAESGQPVEYGQSLFVIKLVS